VRAFVLPEISAVETIAQLAASGAQRAPITRTFSFDQVGDAFGAIRDGTVGKIAIHP